MAGRRQLLAMALACAVPGISWADGMPVASPAPRPRRRPAASPLDHSGSRKVGKASYYARRFGGRKMADGTPMRLDGNNAASRTLPLGTTARITNLRNGKTAVVTIRDRGPFVGGRIVDVSPRTAQDLGFLHQGVAQVMVEPISVPQPDGSVKVVMASTDSAERGI